MGEKSMDNVPSNLKALQFLIKFSSIQDDQKEINKIEDKEKNKMIEQFSSN